MLWAVLALFMAGALSGASEPPAGEHLRRGAELAAHGSIDGAEREYLAAIRLDPESVAAYNNLGVLYFQKQDFVRAAGAFEHARQLQPKDPEIAFNLGLALYKSGETRRAISHLSAAIGSSHTLDAHYLLGACYFSEKEWAAAITELEQLHSQASDRPESLFMLVHAYRYLGKARESLETAERLLKSWPDSPFTHQILGEAYDKDGQPDKAVDEFRQAIAAQPSAPELHFMLGYVYWRWKRYEEAIAPLEQEVRINPGYAPAYYYLGDIALRRDDNAQALRHFQSALRLDRSYADANLGLGKLYFRTGRIDDAIAVLEQAKSTTDSTEVHYWLGRALTRAGREEQGRQELDKVKQTKEAQNRQMGDAMNNGVPVGDRAPGAARP